MWALNNLQCSFRYSNEIWRVSICNISAWIKSKKNWKQIRSLSQSKIVLKFFRCKTSNVWRWRDFSSNVNQIFYNENFASKWKFNKFLCLEFSMIIIDSFRWKWKNNIYSFHFVSKNWTPSSFIFFPVSIRTTFRSCDAFQFSINEFCFRFVKKNNKCFVTICFLRRLFIKTKIRRWRFFSTFSSELRLFEVESQIVKWRNEFDDGGICNNKPTNFTV